MDTILEAARKKRADLVQELKKLDEFLDTYQALRVEFGIGAENTEGTSSPADEPTNSVSAEQKEAAREAEGADEAPERTVRVRDNPSPAVVVDAAAELIRARGRPMSRRSIHTALKEQGIHVRGADEVKALGTMLWRSGKEKLVQIEGKGYGLKGVDYEEPSAWDGYFAMGKRVE